jgi:hypothetical protein
MYIKKTLKLGASKYTNVEQYLNKRGASIVLSIDPLMELQYEILQRVVSDFKLKISLI